VALLQLIPAGATAANQQASRRVIVLLKNQETGLPATKRDFGRRRAAIQRLQAPIRSQLSASGANSVKAFTVLNAVSATVSPNEASQLKSNPAVREVVPDQAIRAGARGGDPGARLRSRRLLPAPGAGVLPWRRLGPPAPDCYLEPCWRTR